MDTIGTATYSLEDNKLRLYPYRRLDPEVYARVKAAGFIWASKQELFVAPMWTPAREDLLLELCEDIEDEDMSVAERAEARAARFDTYSDNADNRADQAKAVAEQVSGRFEFGQPILVGHHSEKKARKDAEKIRNNLHRAVDEMKKSDYWESRARASLRHAERREKPDVIARRIKTLEADKRSRERDKTFDKYWLSDFIYTWKQENLTDERREEIGYSMAVTTFQNCNMTEDEIVACYNCGAECQSKITAYADRWIEHLDNRIAYEREMLKEKGGLAVEGKTLEVGGAVLVRDCWQEITRLNKSAGNVVSVTTRPNPRYNWMSKDVVPVERAKDVMTKAEYEETGKPVIVAKTEPVKSYVHEPKEWEALEAAADSVQAVTANELFPTPEPVIARMLELADIRAGNIVLEPNAGTGAILKALQPYEVFIIWCEINQNLARALTSQGWGEPDGYDFLEYHPVAYYDRAVMNPPFSADVEHVSHAFDLLAAGGRVVSVMSEHAFIASDKRSRDFREWLSLHGWDEPLPPDSFKASGTGVNTRLVVLNK